MIHHRHCVLGSRKIAAARAQKNGDSSIRALLLTGVAHTHSLLHSSFLLASRVKAAADELIRGHSCFSEEVVRRPPGDLYSMPHI